MSIYFVPSIAYFAFSRLALIFRRTIVLRASEAPIVPLSPLRSLRLEVWFLSSRFFSSSPSVMIPQSHFSQESGVFFFAISAVVSFLLCLRSFPTEWVSLMDAFFFERDGFELFDLSYRHVTPPSPACLCASVHSAVAQPHFFFLRCPCRQPSLFKV